MPSIIVILLIFALSVHVFPIGISLNAKKYPVITIIGVLIVSALQTLMLWLGLKLAGTFLYLLEGWDKGILFTGFFLIAVRMFMESFKIINSIRAYRLDQIKWILLTGIVQGTDAFLTGILFFYLPEVNIAKSLSSLFILSVLLLLPSVLSKPSANFWRLGAFLYVAGAFTFAFSSIYFMITL